jgi:uncharacterized repeat protein (TIGR01451 family)
MHAAHTGAHTDESNREVLAMPSVTELATLRWRTFVNIAPVLAMLAALAFAGSAAAQTLGKAFSPTTIAGGGTTTLTFTVTNPAGAPAVSNVGFVDTLPSGLRVANPGAVGGTCANAAAATTANAGAGTITTTNLQVPAGASSCTVTVNVTNATGQVNASCAGNPAAFTNGAANVAVTNVVNAATASCVTVLSPTLGKSFSPTTIGDGGTTTLTFTVTNPAGAPAVSNVGFVDTLPSGLRVATPAAVGGTCANAAAATIANAGASTITTSNLQVPAGAASCTVTVNVTNASGQVNASCAGDPAAFTNSVENVGVTNVVNGVTPVCISMTSPTATAVAIPTLGQWVLMLLAMLVAGVAARQRRWR